MSTTIADIEKSTKAFSEAHADLGALAAEINIEVALIKKKYRARILAAVAKRTAKKCELQKLIESAPDLFKKPRTYVFHDVKVGMQKGRGGIEIVDEVKSIELVRKNLPGQEKTLIVTEESLVKAALNNLPVSDLKKIGCNVRNADDYVVISPVATAVDEAIESLIQDSEQEAA